MPLIIRLKLLKFNQPPVICPSRFLTRPLPTLTQTGSHLNTANATPPDFYGMVGRDPWYEFNTDPVHFPNSLNTGFLENMAQQMQFAGARWIRIEFHADSKPGCAVAILIIINMTLSSIPLRPNITSKCWLWWLPTPSWQKMRDDADLYYAHINDGLDSPTGANPFIRFFANRVKEIADHYGS